MRHFYWSVESPSYVAQEQTHKFYFLNISDDTEPNSKLSDQIKTYEPDFVLLLEVTEDWLEYLKTNLAYPYAIHVPDSDSNMLILSKKPVELLKQTVGESYNSFIMGKVSLGKEKSVNLLLWHALQPLIPENFHLNKVLCRRLSSLVRHSEERYLVFGDFNATPRNRCFNWFGLDERLTHVMYGRGLYQTWNARMPLFNLSIDHIFYNLDFKLIDYQRLETVGSEHYPQLVEFEL